MHRHDAHWVCGYFTEPEAFKAACAASHKAGHRGHHAFTPYPIHGIERLMGIRRSWVGRPVLFMLLTGALLGFLMQWWMMKQDWPLRIAGKPYNSWPAYVVITFESGILCGALTNLLVVLLVACGLLPSASTRLPSPRLTDDTFCLAVPASSVLRAGEIEQWMREHGAEQVETLVPAPTAVAAPAGAHHA